MQITWTNCAEQMPPDDETEIILRCYGILTHTNGMTALRVHLNPYAGYTKWTEYTEEKWEYLNK